MSEKVMITQAQADAIDTLKNKFDGVRYTDLFDALKNGYEVEPEYEKWNYIVHKSGDIRQVVNVYEECLEIEDDDGDRFFWNKKYVRHATKSEIAQEKERQKWEKIGRKPDEYHHYDIAYDNMHDCYVEVDDPAVPTTPFLRVANLDDKSDSREIDPFQLTLVCPADKRFDHE